MVRGKINAYELQPLEHSNCNRARWRDCSLWQWRFWGRKSMTGLLLTALLMLDPQIWGWRITAGLLLAALVVRGAWIYCSMVGCSSSPNRSTNGRSDTLAMAEPRVGATLGRLPKMGGGYHADC
jgi:hypothetical protein